MNDMVSITFVDELASSGAYGALRFLNARRKLLQPALLMNPTMQNSGVDGDCIAAFAGLNINHVHEGALLAIPRRLVPRESKRLQELVQRGGDGFFAHRS